MGHYNPAKIEKKWQKYWEDNKVFRAEDFKGKKFYGLIEFPYPSGEGLHTGHMRSPMAMDIICRQKRMQGYNVLYPIGMDAFGLPAENYAIKTNTPPQITTKKNIDTYIRQLTSAGFSFDWSRFLATTDKDYYKWTQWIFIQMFKQGLAYKAKENINWCPSCQIGLANEEVVGGVCERCGSKVIKKEKEQWLLKITKYADRLLAGLKKIDFLETIKKQQSDWIGKSQGAEIDFKIANTEETIKVFTTRPDTLFGVTFMVLAPEHPLLNKFKDKIKNFAQVRKYITAASRKTEIDRSQGKTGVELKGLSAINPANNKAIPIFVADYVMMNYGTGAIMAVPAHDERDWEFAKKYKLDIIEVIEPLFDKTEGEDAFRPNQKYIERNAVVCVIKHWSQDKYLCLQWKRVDWRGFVVGGIESGEEVIEAAEREIKEETGYTNIKFIKKLGGIVHARFYQTLKKENRWAHFQGLYFELMNDNNIGISEKEKAIHDIKWFKRQEVAKFLNVPDMQTVWQRAYDQSVYSGQGVMTNSGTYNGLLSTKFYSEIIKWLAKNKLGKAAINYKLHDWIFSRQRYWGEPIPMVNCPKCARSTSSGQGWQPVKESDLPIILPDIKDFKPTKDGQSPLAKLTDWVKTTCPKCGGEAQRETDVMPNWAGSNWYFIRYTDPKNSKELVDKKKAKYWLPVDWYNGGMEHTNLHLLYSRFIFKFLFDIGVVPKEVGDEPYKKRTAQGMILGQGGIKMSKSKGNVINPDDYIARYGADAVRIYEMFMGPFDQTIAWDDKGVVGVYRFLSRIWDLETKVSGQTADKKISQLLHQTIKKVSEDIAIMHFNTAVSQMMILVNALEKQENISQSLWSDFIKILSPFAPHLAEELWSKLGHKKSIIYESWPVYNAKLAKEEEVTIAIQINGKLRDTIILPFDSQPSETIKKAVLARDKIQKHLAGKNIKKFIHIKNKIISIVV